MPEAAVSHLPSLLGALLLVGVLLGVPRMHFLARGDGLAIDVLAGVALGYVFVDLLPHLAAKQPLLAAATDGGLLGFLEHHAYVLSMAGFLLLIAILVASEHGPEREGRLGAAELGFALLAGLAGLVGYAGLIGYMIAEFVHDRPGTGIGFAVAMAAHFLGLFHLYRERHTGLYDARLRFALAGAVLVGWIYGVLAEAPATVRALLFASLAGGLIGVTAALEVTRVDSWRRFGGFAAGAVGFSLYLLAIEAFT